MDWLVARLKALGRPPQRKGLVVLSPPVPPGLLLLAIPALLAAFGLLPGP